MKLILGPVIGAVSSDSANVMAQLSEHGVCTLRITGPGGETNHALIQTPDGFLATGCALFSWLAIDFLTATALGLRGIASSGALGLRCSRAKGSPSKTPRLRKLLSRPRSLRPPTNKPSWLSGLSPLRFMPARASWHLFQIAQGTAFRGFNYSCQRESWPSSSSRPSTTVLPSHLLMPPCSASLASVMVSILNSRFLKFWNQIDGNGLLKKINV